MTKDENKGYLDYGRHIEGSRIDAMKKISYEEIKDLDLNQQWSKALKDNLWPKPMLGKKDLYVEYCIDELRNTVRKRAKLKNKTEIKLYNRELMKLKSLTEECETEEQIMNLIKLFNQKYFKHLFFRKVNMNALNRDTMEALHFGVPSEEIPRREAEKAIRLLPIDRNNCEVDGTRCIYKKDNKYYIYKVDTEFKDSYLNWDNSMLVVNNRVVSFQADSYDYNKAMDEFVEAYIKDHKRQFANRIRLGHLDIIGRKGPRYSFNREVYSGTFAKEFGFYGVQYGRWLMFKERTQLLNQAFDALHDLADALNLNPNSISFNGEIGIAFGARGSSTQRAFYELDNKVISLTRVLGQGHLAEVWFNALDHYLSIINGVSTDYYSRRAGKYESFNKLLEKVLKPGSRFLAESMSIDAYEERRTPKWSLRENMLARAFTSYIIDKLNEQDRYDDFLAYEFKPMKTEDGHEFSLYPQGEERKEFNQLFDQLFEELRSEGILEPNKDI